MTPHAELEGSVDQITASSDPHAELEGSVDQITASSDILGPLKSASLY